MNMYFGCLRLNYVIIVTTFEETDGIAVLRVVSSQDELSFQQMISGKKFSSCKKYRCL